MSAILLPCLLCRCVQYLIQYRAKWGKPYRWVTSITDNSRKRKQRRLIFTDNKLTSTRQHNKYLFEYIGYMFRTVNRSSSGLQHNKSQVLFRYWDPNIFTVVNVHKIWYWIKCETYNVWLKQVKACVGIWHFGQILSPFECSLDYGCYCTFTRCGETCVVQPLMVVRLHYCGNFRILKQNNSDNCRSQWPRGLSRRSAAALLMRLWVRIPLWAWRFICCECCVLSVEGSATSWSLVQRSPTDCGASLRVI